MMMIMIVMDILKVGDVILEERPVAWGPKQLSQVCCVACCAPLGYFEISWCERYLDNIQMTR